ncbi:MAG: sigma-70 family RNA polymerase sigma factor [Saprospiraceae bacterium]|nr:sigma-70 family RNA polymerase sigma factor [Saprospiraceae bacterium]
MHPSDPHFSGEHFRVLYGKLFAGLLQYFGVIWLNEIEDAIQNSFYKALKISQSNNPPANFRNWLFIVAKNDVINQINKQKKSLLSENSQFTNEISFPEEDPRLTLLLYLTTIKSLSSDQLVLFLLKNIFGLSVKEIAGTTLLSEDNVYKNIQRIKQKIKTGFDYESFCNNDVQPSQNRIQDIEEVLYAVFNIGFDTHNPRIESIVNDDLCIDAIALTRLLFAKYKRIETRNLLALFCFHSARLPSKTINGHLVPFFEQDKTLWDHSLIQSGIKYLEKPHVLHKFYIEAIIVSKHMLTEDYDKKHWNEVISLYEMWYRIEGSPFILLNLTYCYYKAEKYAALKNTLQNLESVFSNDNFYYTLLKTEVFDEWSREQKNGKLKEVLRHAEQEFRKKFISDKIKETE